MHQEPTFVVYKVASGGFVMDRSCAILKQAKLCEMSAKLPIGFLLIDPLANHHYQLQD
jgi:hypothetical protein